MRLRTPGGVIRTRTLGHVNTSAMGTLRSCERPSRRSGLLELFATCYSALPMRRASGVLGGAFAVCVVLLLGGCATGSGSYVWVNDYKDPPQPPQPGYLIEPGDLIQIRVFNQPDMSTRARVREDGKVSIPFLNDVTVAGLDPNALAKQLQTRLKEFINAPVVTVSLEEARPFSVAVMGELVRPGLYPVPQGAGVLQALAAAGGFNQYASKSGIYVVRDAPDRARIRFTYEQLTQPESKAAMFRLRPGDSVVVE